MALDGLNDNNKHNGFVFAGNMQARLVNYDVTLVARSRGIMRREPTTRIMWHRWIAERTSAGRPSWCENYRLPGVELPGSNRRKSTALVGLSMGSVGILNLAQRFPQRYTAVNAMSGFYTLSRPLRAGVLAVGSQMVGYQPRRMWGPWPTGQWRAHDPSLNITRYTMPVRASCGNGTSLTGVEPPPFAVVAEVASHVDTEDFQKMVAFAPNRKNFTFRIANKGAHNWAFWRMTCTTTVVLRSCCGVWGCSDSRH
ncbi:MAG: alpha/beta hydrolase-fold protein [Lawsonella clevelandensis]